METVPLQVGDRVRVVRIPPHLDTPDCPPETARAFSEALGNVYCVDEIDWGGWVWLLLRPDEGIGVQPDCVELVDPVDEN